jgi:amidase
VTAELVFRSAADLTRLVRRREISAGELLDAHLAQIQAVNPAVNAIVTLVAERARVAAEAADARLARGEEVGPLHGLPVAHKDLVATAGIRTTLGSPIYKDWVPDADAIVVERLRAAGAITVGKTNTPEFGAGSQTFNPVFGATANPYALDRTCGGSSGGAAVALACGMVPIADGSDTGGSLRNPAAFCNVVGFRPSAGRVPDRGELPWQPLSTTGPMARTVGDVALVLAAISGPDARAPLSQAGGGAEFLQPLAAPRQGLRVAWSPALGGLPVEADVAAVLERAVPVFAELGCVVEPADPDLAGADEAFETLRAWTMESRYGRLAAERPGDVKETVRWNIEIGRSLSGPQVAAAMRAQAAVQQQMRAFFERFDLLLCPVTQVAPFSLETEYPAVVAATAMGSYIEWMRTCSRISVTGLPAISVPAGFTGDGLPVGIQLVGPWRSDRSVLELAAAFEDATRWGERRPAIALA